ncbi:MAG TPA: radical SAM protein [Thermoanaerobaculia bacterium]|nr:radical SAM protein [Thermoanaerobaculia bacterium]
MRVGILTAHMDYHRKGRHHRGALQPQIGPLIAALLPREVEVEVINDTWEEPDWTRDYDLLFIGSMHSDFDRARQISHYWRLRGARTVFGGILASTYPELCQPFFDALIIGDPEDTVPRLFADFCRQDLQPLYVSGPYDPCRVPVPRFDLLARKQKVPLSLEATRGCPFTCEFCALTSIGTRHHVRPVELVVRDIRQGQEMLRDLVPWPMRRIVAFMDNNFGGNLGYLRSLCEALAPLKLHWSAAVTFNVVSRPEHVRMMAEAGCYYLFMGLESFNPETLSDMHKHQNAIELTRQVMDQCRAQGILVDSGLMLNPTTDDCAYMESVPRLLTESGLHVPSFICFEAPIPGTPHFHRLAADPEPALLPNALLRDFTGYTLVTRPRRESLTDFIAGYRELTDKVFSSRQRMGKLLDDIPRFLRGGHPFPMLADLIEYGPHRWNPHPLRTFVAGTDVPPPEALSVPLTDRDFVSQEERDAVVGPWRVTGPDGAVLPQWRSSLRVFDAKGRISEIARNLAA